MARPKTRYETRWRGPTGRRERYTVPVHVARYVCASDAGGCGRTSILAEPTEQLIAAAVTLRRGSPLPNGSERQRAAIGHDLLRLEVMPGQPGSTPGRARYDPTRLKITFADGRTMTGTPLPRDAVPWVSWPYNRSTANQDHGEASGTGWQAIYRAAGAVLAWPV